MLAHSSRLPTEPLPDPEIALDIARVELRALPVLVLSALPLQSRIRVQHKGTQALFDVHVGVMPSPSNVPARARRRASPAAKRSKRASIGPEASALCSFDADELEALAMGAEVGRTFGSDLIAFALRKMHDPSFRVTLEHALAGTYLRPAVGTSFTFEDLLRVLELELVGIDLVTSPESVGAAPAAA